MPRLSKSIIGDYFDYNKVEKVSTCKKCLNKIKVSTTKFILLAY